MLFLCMFRWILETWKVTYGFQNGNVLFALKHRHFWILGSAKFQKQITSHIQNGLILN